MFKNLRDCIELYKQGKKPDTEFWYVFNCEETDIEEFDINGDIEAQISEIEERSDYDLDNGQDIYSEFTTEICPAYSTHYKEDDKIEDPSGNEPLTFVLEKNDKGQYVTKISVGTEFNRELLDKEPLIYDIFTDVVNSGLNDLIRKKDRTEDKYKNALLSDEVFTYKGEGDEN